ncbi:hypothetical protein PCL_02663 [Purpureocillium lilacinum]|uniref:Uncharacterized protein n=1 Tax=Purpureocillium lilacinum TaxID=33203 RepID=A0A2U3DZS7_PURLI|nr:hypothetical protein PCL_02663 [Purpureocillium lilacinum]
MAGPPPAALRPPTAATSTRSPPQSSKNKGRCGAFMTAAGREQPRLFPYHAGAIIPPSPSPTPDEAAECIAKASPSARLHVRSHASRPPRTLTHAQTHVHDGPLRRPIPTFRLCYCPLVQEYRVIACLVLENRPHPPLPLLSKMSTSGLEGDDAQGRPCRYLLSSFTVLLVSSVVDVASDPVLGT